jgi:hypothetical protein
MYFVGDNLLAYTDLAKAYGLSFQMGMNIRIADKSPY